jgi:hypothetical protein
MKFPHYRFSKSCLALEARMGATLLRLCPISAGHSLGIPASACAVPAVPVSSERLAVGAIECGNHPGILDITHGQCSVTPNAARLSLPITRLAGQSLCRAWSRAERLARTVSDRLLFGSLVATRGGERLSERNASISTSWRPYPYRSRTPQRGSVMFRDRHYESRPFCEVVISHTTPRGRSGRQAGEPPPPE